MRPCVGGRVVDRRVRVRQHAGEHGRARSARYTALSRAGGRVLPCLSSTSCLRRQHGTQHSRARGRPHLSSISLSLSLSLALALALALALSLSLSLLSLCLSRSLSLLSLSLTVSGCAVCRLSVRGERAHRPERALTCRRRLGSLQWRHT